MTTERYDLVFSGELARGAELAQAKRNLGNLFKISAEKVEALFSGKPVVLKKDLDFATGTKYRVAIKKAGCVVALQEKKAPAPKAKAVFAVPAGEPASPSAFSSVSSAPASSPPLPEVESEPEASGKAAVAPRQEKTTTAGLSESLVKPQKTAEPLQTSSFDLTPVGSNVLNESEREHVSPVQVDLSGLSIDPEGGDLLHENEKTHFEARDIQVDASLAPVGAELIEDSEKEPVEAVQVHIPDVSLAEVGELLEQEKDERPKVNPDISHLSLE